MNQATKVRMAGPADVVELARMRHAMFVEMAAAGAAARPDDVTETSWYPAASRRLISQMDSGALAAFVVDENTVAPRKGYSAGLAACAVVAIEQRLPGPGFPSGVSGSMSSVFVEPASRRQGMARAVVSAGLAWLDDMGAETVDLHATPDAERLYRSVGFTPPRSTALRRVRDR